MKFVDIVRLALAGVTNNKFRSFLTLLGIIIGVGAVILMVTLGDGTKAVVTGQFEGINNRLIFVGSNYELPYQQRGRLTLEDSDYLAKSTLGAKEVIPFFRFNFKVKYNNQEVKNDVAGVNSQALEVTNLKLKYGRGIQVGDVKGRKRIAVVSEDVLRELVNLSDYSSLLGEAIYIDGQKLIIVGILGKSNSTIGLRDNSTILPYTTAKDLWRRRTRYVDYYLVTYDKLTAEADIRSQVSYLLDKKYGKTVNNKSKFRTDGIQGEINVINKVVNIFSYVLGGIASISLLVGGIGVMNIMLVTIKERTKEIGLRLAVGATRRDIQGQFLLETIILSVSGGILGIVCGILLSIVANMGLSHFFSWWQSSIPLWIIFVSFFVTVGIGVIFGFYPAYKASKLDPIEALR